jgi:basic amino acid/polyamine antiporter, APA family
MSTAANQPAEAHGAEGQLGLWDAVSIIVGIVIGTSIFQFPPSIFGSTPNVWMALAVWLFGGILAFVGGLCYAELATTYPRAGGDYYYLTAAFSRLTGFLFGWAQLIVILPASIGVMAFVFANFATEIHAIPDFLEMGFSSQFYYATISVLVITLLNIIGVTLGKLAQNILTAAKVIGLLAILVCGFIAGDLSQTDWNLPADMSGVGWGSLALILVMYAYGGWNDAAFVAAEVRNRRRNIPFALMFGIGAITLIYLLVNFAYVLGLGFSAVQWAERSLPGQLLENVLGEHGGNAMRAIVMTSALGAMNGLIFTGSRVYAALGNDHRLFGFLGHWRPGRGAPILALIVQALITLGLVLLFGTQQGHDSINRFLDGLNSTLSGLVQAVTSDYEVRIEYVRAWSPVAAFDQLISHSAPAFWLFFLLTGFSLFKLRELNPTLERPFSVPWFPIIPIIFCNMCVYMLYRSIIYIEWRTLFVVALLLVGLPLYLFSQALGVPKRTE